MRTFLLALALFAVMGNSSSARAGTETHGGDSFDNGDATQVFDQLEYSEDFHPLTYRDSNGVNVYNEYIRPRLDALARKLPQTARCLESLFGEQGPMWWLVKAKLKEVDDEGQTNIILTYNKQQVAVNQNGLVQIRKDIWEKLEADSKAFLMVHEVLWMVSAVSGTSGAQIRALTAIFFNSSLDQYAPNRIASLMRQFAGPSSPLAKALDADSASSYPIEKERYENTRRCLARIAEDGDFVSGRFYRAITSRFRIWIEKKLASGEYAYVLGRNGKDGSTREVMAVIVNGDDASCGSARKSHVEKLDNCNRTLEQSYAERGIDYGNFMGVSLVGESESGLTFSFEQRTCEDSHESSPQNCAITGQWKVNFIPQ